MKSTGKTLHVDRNRSSAPDRASSLEEALARLISDEYDTIVLHGAVAGHDDFGLVEYLAATWPDFRRSVTVRCVAGDDARVWNMAAAQRERQPRRIDRASPRPRSVIRDAEARGSY